MLVVEIPKEIVCVMEILDLFRLIVSKTSSDFFGTAGAPTNLKVNGQILSIKTTLTRKSTQQLAYSPINDSQRRQLEVERESVFVWPVSADTRVGT